ncbi:MAG: 5'-nucleotidase C-terminal domain-containing protein [Fimbriimonadaceae bacterium]|nr:5'-nucleotidase C-terminal domain-containing protein [Fimbriimonadaceae bacterium]
MQFCRFRLNLVGVTVGLAAIAWGQSPLTVTILHTNDSHARMEPAAVRGVEIGGRSRLVSAAKAELAVAENPIVLDAGDVFQGTLYFNVYEGLADLAVMNHLGYDAMAVGNHEFDRGDAPLAEFARHAEFPLLAANLDVSGNELLRDLIKASTVIEVQGQKVGIIGAVTATLPTISSMPDTVKMRDLRSSIQGEIDRLATEGVNKIIVVAHVGWREEAELIASVRGIDVMVGGHSHSLLGTFTMPIPGNPTAIDGYPVRRVGADGAPVLHVTAFEWSKVLGKLIFTFDANGRIESVSNESKPIVIDDTIPKDPYVETLIAAYRKPIQAMAEKEIGTVSAAIERGNHLQGESAMANLIADSMLEATKVNGCVAAFMNGGGVRASYEAGPLTFGAAITVQPFANTLAVLDLTGAELKAALEHGVAALPEASGALLHPSHGTSYAININRPVGQRVSDIVVAGEPIEPQATYRIAFNSFTASGGDDHQVLKAANGYRYETGLVDIDAMVDYIAKLGRPLTPVVEGRIKVFQ